MNIPLPNILEQIINRNFNNISNLNLSLTKYVNGWKENWEFESKGKGEYIEKAIKSNYDKITYTKFLARWEILLHSINSIQIKGKVLWRLVVGLGSGSVLETSMTLHHIFGVPFIPGTALKGVVSSYYIERNRENLTKGMEVANSQRKRENKREYKTLEEYAMNEDANYIELFGNENQKGKLTFLDAYPTTFPNLEIDIMNPHFGDYYDGKTPPADWLSPKPIKFLTVAKDTEFIFAFKTDKSNLIPEVKTLIKESLQDFGIGAKTSVGYGYFKNMQDTIITSENQSIPIKKQNTETIKQELPGYLKSETELKDEFLRSDGTIKSEEEYKSFIESSGRVYNKERKQQYEKARKWYEKNKVAK